MKKQHLLFNGRVFRSYALGILAVLFCANKTFAQALTGVKTIPGTYSSIALAVADLNAKGVGLNGVTFNISAGYTEVLTQKLLVTATGTAANPIVFQKSGGGANPSVTAYAGTKLAGSNDSVDVMWAFEGSDYVTIKEIDLNESGANVTAGGANLMEVGYGFYKASGTDGANNNTVQNCIITLSRNNNATASTTGPRNNVAGSVAIELMACSQATVGTMTAVTAMTGASSNNRFYGNTLQNCNFGIALSGVAAASPYTLADVNNDIGGNSTITGNNILNFGGGTSATNACGAMYISNQWSFNISYNTVNNNNGSGINHAAGNRGIWLYASSVGAGCDITNNKITISGGANTGAINWCLDLEMAQSGANGNTINVSNNQFLNCNVLAASTVAFTAVWLNTAATTVNVNDNYFYGFSYAGTGVSEVILSQLACGTLNILNNTIDSTVLSGATAAGSHYNIGVTAAPTIAVNIKDNEVTRTSLNTAGAGSKTLYGIYYSGATPSTNILDNTVNDISRNGTTGGTTIGIYQAGGTNGVSTTTVKRNTVSNLSIGGGGVSNTMYGIQTSTGTIICDSNTVFNLSCTKATGTGNVYGIYDISAPSNENFNYNTIYNLTHAGTGITYGLYTFTTTGVRTVSRNTIYGITGGGVVAGISQNSSVPSVFGNKIYNLSTTGTSSVVSGILIGSTTAGTAKVYNNLISGLTAAASNGGTTATVRGIDITSTTASTTIGVYYNTINLNATSSGVNFSSAGIYHAYSATATTVALDMRNNIIVNTSTANGTGFTAAFRRSAAGIGNFAALSNNNLLYAGTPGTKNLIYYDGTNADQTLPAYVTRVTPRDTNSISENPTFASVAGTSPQFLKLDLIAATNAEGTARNIAGVTTDFDGTIRAGNAGYTGNGGAPDMGAWEADYTGQPANQMYFDSASADQFSTTPVPIGTTNNIILKVRVYSNKGSNALAATSFKMTTASSTSPLDISSAKVYYTGSNNSFSTADLFGSTPTPGASFYVTGNKRLTMGVNYFWVVYDISNTATGGNFVDASVDSITLSGVNQSLAVNNPAGNRKLAAKLNGIYTVGTSQTYPSITAAVADLTALGVSGPVTFRLTDIQYDTLSTNEVFPIVLGAYAGSSTVNTVTIVPASGIASRIVCINSSPVFRFDGGSNYMIDGRMGSTGGFVPGNNLIVENTHQSGNAISFVNDADSNSIYYVDVKGANTLAAGNAGAGVINIGTTTGANGNDRNTIRKSHIHESVGGFPTVAVSSIGSATTVAANNENNMIDSCDIYNFFNPAVANAAIYVGANNGNWQINSNKFYQQGIRTYTAAATHRVLWITPNTANLTSASGFVISNNYIGGDNTSGTGVYEMRGSAAFLFGPMDISVGLGVATQVWGNTITNIVDSTGSTGSNAFCAINLANGNVNVYNNLIGSRTTNGAIVLGANSTTSCGAMGIRTGGGTGNTFNIYNNIISGFDLYGNTATATPEFFGMNIFTGNRKNVYNNMVGDTSLVNSIHNYATSMGSTISQRFSGIYYNPNVAVVDSIYNNVFANFTNEYAFASGASTPSLTKGITVYPASGGTGSVYIANNQIRNLSTSSLANSTGFFATLAGISADASQAAINVFIAGNKVSQLTLTNASTTAAVQAIGILFKVPASGTHIASGNFVHSLSMTNANPAAILTGIEMNGGNGTVANNMIRLGIDGTGADIVTACSMKGIHKSAGNAGVYFNTVYMGGINVGPDYNRTFAFQRSAAGTDVVNNNIFINNRMNAALGGGHYAVGLNNNTTLTQNYNVLVGDSIGLYNTTQLDNLTQWKSTSGVDASSVSSNLAFVNATGNAASLDLHINPAIATPIEAYGTPVAVAGTDVDFDGQLRSGLTPVDIGADAGNFTASDIAGPAINYTLLTNTAATGDRTLTATITDVTGVYTVGANRPRVYFKKMAAGSWISNPGTLVSGTKTNGTWSFTISSSPLGGLFGGDSVYYYVVAQDSTTLNTLGSFPLGAEGSNVNAITTDPLPVSYKIIPTVTGLIPVGAGQPITTLTGSNGLFNYLNTSAIGGDITVQVVSDIEEPGTVGLNPLMETGVGGYKIKIQPDAAVVRNLTGNVTTGGAALINLNGADRVSIDGSYLGAGQYLRIMNRGAGNTVNFQNDADNDTLANCVIEGMNTVAATIYFGSNASGGTGNDSNAIIGCIIRDTVGATGTNLPNTGFYSTGGNNDYNTFSNNEVFNFSYGGVFINTTGDNFWTISNNKFYQQRLKNVAVDVVRLHSGSGHIISGNSIGGSAADRSGTAYTTTTTESIAIWIASTVATTYPIQITNNIISNFGTVSAGVNVCGILVQGGGIVNVTGNTIGGGMNVYDTLRTGGGSLNYGAIHIGSGANSNVKVTNNLVSNLSNYNAAAVVTAGITVNTTTAASILVDNNTVKNISGNNTSLNTATTTRLAGILVGASPSVGTVISGNRVSNIQSTNTGTVAYAPAGIMVAAGSTANVSIVRNFVKNVGAVGTGTGSNAPNVYGIQLLSGTNCTVANNQVTLGDSAMNESVVYGIGDNVTTSGPNTYAYNSVFINGTTSAGTNHSFAFYRSSTPTVKLVNNILYNRRTSLGTGFGYAVGAASATSVNSTSINYNLLLTADTNKLVMMPTNVNNGWSALNSLFTTTYNTNWAENATTVPAEFLFTDIQSGNLNIVNTNNEAWYANGKGIALTNVYGDYADSSAVRSVTIAGGATDIGADEFTPASVTPLAYADKSPFTNDSTQFFFGSRMVAKINWLIGGTLPSSVALRYHSGANAPAAPVSLTKTNAYWNFLPTGGSGYNYHMTLMNDSAILGTVANLAANDIAMYVTPGNTWADLTNTTVDAVKGLMTSNNVSGTLGIFTGTDGNNNPLPVALTTFTASVNHGDVLLNWTTASEINNRGFEVERSLDGRSFEMVGFVKGAGNSARAINYKHADVAAFERTSANVLYYRLKQLDANGAFVYSEIVSVGITKGTKTMTLYPNPFSYELKAGFQSEVAGMVKVRVLNLQGMEVKSQYEMVTKGFNTIEVEGVTELNAGMYFVELTINGETVTVKMLKD